MKEILPPRGIELREIRRLETDEGLVVSASTVRSLLKSEDWEALRKMVPNCTWDYLHSEKGKKVIDHLRGSRGRH